MSQEPIRALSRGRGWNASRGFLWAGALFAAALAPAIARGDDRPAIRGVTISCPRSGEIWATQATAESMERLERLGANWVAIHPYARIEADGSVRGGHLGPRRSWVRRPIEAAKSRGLRILIKPHLGYWGSPFSWRGAITFDEPAEWDRFFRTYRRWIVAMAELATDADGFVVGTELDRTVGREQRWRRIIRAVRETTEAPLTYAANWSEYQKVPFWDALDAIGIQAYFPLADSPGLPTREALDRAWAKRMARIEAYAREQDRPVVFTELGYNQSHRAAVRPWDDASGGPRALAVKRRCLAAGLAAVARSDRVAGAFLWKWFPHSPDRETFRLNTPPMRAVLRAAWHR